MSTRPIWIPACIGIGSNLGDPVHQVRSGLSALALLPETRVVLQSSLYRNPPMGQPDYVNAVAIVLTTLAPRRLLDGLQHVERDHGRHRISEQRWGPRQLDLDLLTYAWRRVDEDGLHIPHPGIPARNFVLLPLLEVAPLLQIPGVGSVWKLAAAMDASTLERIC